MDHGREELSLGQCIMLRPNMGSFSVDRQSEFFFFYFNFNGKIKSNPNSICSHDLWTVDFFFLQHCPENSYPTIRGSNDKK